ncbi:hypothetical protein D3C87_1049250 [compost metagenome]
MKDSLYELSRSSFLGPPKYLFRGAIFDNHTASAENDARSDVPGKVHIVSHDHHRHGLFSQMHNDLLDFSDKLRIKSRRNFVE